MKLTVCFGDVRVVVPCGDGDFAVNELIQRAVARYKKAAGKQTDCDVKVCVLKSLRDGGILDLDDLLSDVVDDKDQVFAEFVEMPKSTKSVGNFAAHDTAGPIVTKQEEAVWEYITDDKLAATRLPAKHRDGRQAAPAADHASSSSSSTSSSEQDELEDQAVTAVVVTRSDLDKDIGGKQSQLTVRRESEPCKMAVSTAVSQRQQAVTDDTSMEPPRVLPPILLQGSTPRPPSCQLAEVSAELTTSSDERTTDDECDDDGQCSLPRVQQQQHGAGGVAMAAAATAGLPGDAKKHPAPAPGITRLLNGFARSSARQSLGSRNGLDWSTAQERALVRTAARTDAITSVPAAAAASTSAVTEAAATAVVVPPAAAVPKGQPAASVTRGRCVPTSLALAPISAEGCAQPAAAGRQPSEGTCPEQIKTPLPAARHTLTTPEKSSPGTGRGCNGDSSSSDTRCGTVEHSGSAAPARGECDSTKGAAQTSQTGCTVTVKIRGPREQLGFHVAGYFQNGREAGLAIHHLEAGGRMEQEGFIATGDIVQEINGTSLIGVPLDKAKTMLREALDKGDAVLSIVKYKMTEAGSSCAPLGSRPSEAEDLPPASTQPSRGSSKLPPQPPQRSPSTRLSCALQTTNVPERTIDPPHLIGFDEVDVDLVKGAEGLGFTISSREHLAALNDGVAPVFVKTIMPFGAAVADGRLKCGDRLVKINGEDVSHRAQDDIVMLLRGTKQGSTVSIRVLRLQAMLGVPPPPYTRLSAAGSSPGSPADPTYENILVKVADQSVEYGDTMTFDIPTTGIMPGSLGISIKGETALVTEGISDLGVFVKDIVKGGAAHLDGRLSRGDMLLSVNGTTLQGLSNAAAMAALRRAAGECRAVCAVTVARRRQPMGVESEQKQQLPALQQSQAASTPVTVEPRTETPEQNVSMQHEQGHSPAADRLSSPRPATTGATEISAPGRNMASHSQESTVTPVEQEHQHGESGSEHDRPPPASPSLPSLVVSSPAALLSCGSRALPLPLGIAPGLDRSTSDYLSTVVRPAGPTPAQAPMPRSVLPARPTPVPRKSSSVAAQAMLPQCNAATSPMEDEHICRCARRSVGNTGSDIISPGSSGECSTCMWLQQQQLSPEPCSPPPPGFVNDDSNPLSVRAAASTQNRPLLPAGARQESNAQCIDSNEHDGTATLPAAAAAANESLNDKADAVGSSLQSPSTIATSPLVDKVDAAIQCEATSASGSLGRGRWEQRFHRDRSASGGGGGSAGLRRSTPRSQVSDVEKKERRKSELILSSPYPNLVTLAATSFASPPYDDQEASGGNDEDGYSGSLRTRDRSAGVTKDDKPADHSKAMAEAFASGSTDGAAAVLEADAAAAAADDALLLLLQQDSNHLRPERSAYAPSSPVTAWVERTLEHARAQPSPALMSSVRLPVRSPSFTAALPDLATAELSWEDDDVSSQQPVAPIGPTAFPRQRRALSMDSLDSHGSGNVSRGNRSKFSSLESLQDEMKDSYELSAEPQKTRRRVARGRGCNESFRAAVDHSYDASEALFMRGSGAPGSKFDEVHDSGINPLSSSSSSSDQFLGIGKQQAAVKLVAAENNKVTKKDKTKASSFFGHLFRIGKSRKSIEDRQQKGDAKSTRGGRQEDSMGSLVVEGSSNSASQSRLQRTQLQGSWSYHGSHAKEGTAVMAPTMMNEYYHRLMEDQRLQMVLASAISNDSAVQFNDHVYVNWTLPSSRGSTKTSHTVPPQASASTEPLSAVAQPEYSKVKAKQKSEPDLAKNQVPTTHAVLPSHRDGHWSDRIYRLSERDLTANNRVPTTNADWHSQQQQAGLSSRHRHKKTPTTSSVSARRPLSLHDDTDALLIAAHRRAAAANDYANLPAAALAVQVPPKMATDPAHQRRPVTRVAQQRTSGIAGGGTRSSATAPGTAIGSGQGPSGRLTGSARQTNRLSWCYDYSGSSSSDDYCYGKAGSAYVSVPHGARQRAEAARV